MSLLNLFRKDVRAREEAAQILEALHQGMYH